MKHISSKHLALLFLISIGTNAAVLYIGRSSRSEMQMQLKDMVARLEAQQKANSLAASIASNTFRVGFGRLSGSGPFGVTQQKKQPPRFVYISGYCGINGVSGVTEEDGMVIKGGDYWPACEGVFQGISGSYGLIRDAEGLRTVCLLVRPVIKASGSDVAKVAKVEKVDNFEKFDTAIALKE